MALKRSKGSRIFGAVLLILAAITSANYLLKTELLGGFDKEGMIASFAIMFLSLLFVREVETPDTEVELNGVKHDADLGNQHASNESKLYTVQVVIALICMVLPVGFLWLLRDGKLNWFTILLTEAIAGFVVVSTWQGVKKELAERDRRS